MPLEIQSYPVTPNAPRTFTFNDSISQYWVGLSGYQLSYGNNTSHHIGAMSITLLSNHSGSAVTVTPKVVLTNNDGANLDPSDSWINIMVMAWTGTWSGGIVLDTDSNIVNNGNSTPLDIGCTNPSVLQAALTGFNFSFGSDHHLVNYSCSAGTNRNGANASITGFASMQVGNGEAPSIATINGGLIAICDATLNLQPPQPVQLQDSSKDLAFVQGTTKAYPFLTGVQASYFADHHVRKISAYLEISQNQAPNFTVKGGSYLSDNDGHTQDNSRSSVSGFVIGL
jgi:hypothetical protein